MKSLRIRIVLVVVGLALVQHPAWLAAVSSNSSLSEATAFTPANQSLQDLLSRFFGGVKDKVIAGADNVNKWKSEGEAAARKTVSDFASCPSPAAQQLYDDLRSKRQQLANTKATAEQADRDAQAARDNCKRTTGLNAQCDAAYTRLPLAQPQRPPAQRSQQ